MIKKTNSFVIRLFEPSDIDELIALFRLSVQKGTATDYSEDQRQAWAPSDIDRDQWLSKRMSRPTWIATWNNQIIGFSDLEQDGHIDMLYVHPDFYRQGVASALIEQVHETAKQQSIKRLFTEASITARPVFERFGFIVIKEQTVHHNGQNFTNYRMEKSL